MSIFGMYHSPESTNVFCNLAIYYNSNETTTSCIFKCNKCINNKPHICKNCGQINNHRTSSCSRILHPCIFNCKKCILGRPHICENCGRINSHIKKNCPLLKIKCVFKCLNCYHNKSHLCRNCFNSNVHCKNECTFIFCYFCNIFDNHRTFECYKIQQLQSPNNIMIPMNEDIELSKLKIESIDSNEFEKLLESYK